MPEHRALGHAWLPTASPLNMQDVITLTRKIDHQSEFIARSVQGWITAVGARTAYIAPGSPWENGYVMNFNARLRDELLNGKIFYTLKEAQVVIENWRRHYHTIRPHGALGYRPPAPEVFLPAFTA